METPRARPLLRRVHNDHVRSLLAGLRRRGGAGRLVRALGFPPPVPAPPLPAPVPGVRSVLLARRSTLSAWVLSLRKPADGDVVCNTARVLRCADPVRHHLLVLLDPGARRVSLAISAPGAPARFTGVDVVEPRESDLATVAEILDACRAGDSAAAIAIARALDRSRIGARFFSDIVAMRDAVARGWTGLPRNAVQERNALALLLLSRLLFLYFLQHRGVLDSDTAFMPRLWRDWNRGDRAVSFYRCQLETLFFGVLNRRVHDRTARARALGQLPYLNGGLFEQHAVELRAPDHDLPDAVAGRIFTDLLERYRFTSSDAADQQADASVVAGVDPEMLGRIFEGLMPGDRRGRTGSFYTPAATVDALVRRALTYHVAGRTGLTEAAAATALAGDGMTDDAGVVMDQVLRSIRVLDPACGSGAFLMGALTRLADVRSRTCHLSGATAGGLRRAIIGECLHGVDVLEDAALICSLRLWLTLLPDAGGSGSVEPLPNLDRRIRQGDALVDPLDLADMMTGRALDTTAPPELRGLLSDLMPAAHAYMTAEPGQRDALRRTLGGVERGLARAWLDAVRSRLDWDRRDAEARAADTDLFGEPAPHAAAAERRLGAVVARTAELDTFMADLDGAAGLPFFSFRVHFAEAGGGFDLILSNPPWVRSHGWPPTVRHALRSRYAVCRNAGWPAAARLAGRTAAAAAQVDLSLLFLERASRLLAPGGTLAMLLPAKLLRSLYAGGARELVLGGMRVREIDDLSLDHRHIFDADAFPCSLIAQRRDGPAVDETVGDDVVHVTLRRAGVDPIRFRTTQSRLSLVAEDPRSPWLLAPPDVALVIRGMQQDASRLGDVFAIRRGVMTGANRVLVVRDIEPKLGGLSRIRTEGYHRAESSRTRNAYAAWIESDGVRPLLRGTDVSAWHSTVRRHVVWVPANDDDGAATPPRLGRYLHRHRGVLGGDASRNAVPGRLKRLGDAALGHKVVWSDLAMDLRAAAVPATVRSVTGRDTPVIPLNTVYYIAAPDADTSMLLAAYLNSLPLRVFARGIAERAKDAHFRFFAWTVGVLPLPRSWNAGPVAARLTTLSRQAHVRGGATPALQVEVDTLVARAFGIGDAQLTRLAEFDAWLRGKTS